MFYWADVLQMFTVTDPLYATTVKFASASCAIFLELSLCLGSDFDTTLYVTRDRDHGTGASGQHFIVYWLLFYIVAVCHQ